MYTTNNYKGNGFMDQKMREFVDNLYDVVDKLKDEFSSGEKNKGKDSFMGYYDETYDLNPQKSFCIPDERVEKDLHKLTAIVMDYFRLCFDSGDYDAFASSFAMYCNFYIDRGLICRRGDTNGDMFGLHCDDFAQVYDGKLLPYLREIFEGIFTQDFEHFSNAVKIIPEFSVAHLYLFIYFINRYYYCENELEQNPQDKEAAQESGTAYNRKIEEYNNMPLVYRAYVLGSGNFRRSGNPNNDRHLLPYISTMRNRDILHEKLVSWTGELLKAISENNKELFKASLSLAIVNETLDGVNDDRLLNDSYLITPLDRDWRIMTIAERRYSLHICNQISINDPLLYASLNNEQEANANYRELKKAQDDRKRVIDEFSHTYANMQATTLQNIGTRLLRMTNETLRSWGRQVLVEYTIKDNLTKEVELLKLQFEGNIERLLEMLRSTVSETGSENYLSVSDIVSDALHRCFMNLLYAETATMQDQRNMFFGTLEHMEEKKQLKASFEEDVIIAQKPCLRWLGKQSCMDMDVSASGQWERLFFREGGYAALLLTNWLSELLRNAMKYADKTAPIALEFTQEGDILCIRMHNLRNPAFKDIHNSQTGISSIKASVLRLNEASDFTGESVETALSDTEFEICIRLASEIFTERR